MKLIPKRSDFVLHDEKPTIPWPGTLTVRQDEAIEAGRNCYTQSTVFEFWVKEEVAPV